MKSLRLLIASAVIVSGCADAEPDVDEEWGMDGPVEPLPPLGKEDGQYRKGLLVATNTSRTQVWTVRNQWEDRTTPAARAAGLAWEANSGLSWDEKYGAWLESLAYVPAVSYGTTVDITTPWGKTIASPYLECAEMAMFLRITFAAWYLLPIQLEAVSGGRRVYFGHYGVRTAAGRFAQTPEFGIAYRDHTASTTWSTQWPVDGTLRTRKLHGGTDEQRQLGANKVFGAVVDELHLNKRAGYFTVLTLNYLSSMNLADSANTYNLVPDAVRPGDVLLERWQRNGIGHTLVVKQVEELGAGNLDVTLLSGSMPRRQAIKESGIASKNYFTSDYAGGPGTNAAGEAYARLGGGLKRFRVTKNVGGYWTNTWMSGDEAHWINSTDYPRIAARTAQFDALLGQVSPDQQRTQLLSVIADARHHLSEYPASCSARERREHAFRELYELGATALGMTPEEIDAEHRTLDDYVFAELTYTKSKTCCWNSTTRAMYDLIMAKAHADRAAADAAGTCAAPTVFRSRTDGYRLWSDYAQSAGRGAEWRAWSEDEACAQRNILEDTEAIASAAPYCEL